MDQNELRYGATTQEWEAAIRIFGADMLLPSVHNPHATVSPLSSIKSAAAAAKVPSHYNQAGQAVGFSKWSDHTTTTPTEQARWQANGDYGICLRTGYGVIAFDCDTENLAELGTMRRLLIEACGNVVPPCRYRENSNRRTYLVQCPGEAGKIVLTLRPKTDKGGAEAIEILRTGNQTLIAGRHPSGARLKWEQGGITIPPAITETGFNHLLNNIKAAFPHVVASEKKTKHGNVIYSPWENINTALVGDPVAEWLNVNKLIIGNDGRSKFHIKCPNEHYHTAGSGSASSTVYVSDKNPKLCSFNCKHAGCADSLRTPWHFAEALGMPLALRAAYENRNSADANDEFEDLSVSEEVANNTNVAMSVMDDDLFGWRSVDLTSPPGIAGVICRDINRISHRVLPLAAVPAALHILALAAGKGRYRTPDGAKIALTTFTIAPTSAGKETALKYMKRLASNAKLSPHILPAPRGDRDLVMSLVDADAVILSIVDEAHAFLDGVNNANANQYTRALGGLMLELATCSIFPIAGNHRRDLLAQCDNVEKALATQNMKDEAAVKKGKMDELDLIVAQKARAEKMHGVSKRREWCNCGLESPIANFAFASTPEKLEGAISNADINSGMLGRCTVFHCEEPRAKNQYRAFKNPGYSPKHSDTESVIAAICKLAKGDAEGAETRIKYTPEAEAALNAVIEYLDDDERLNAAVNGGLYARGFERVAGVATVLALDSGTIEVEHVRYALAVYMQGVEKTTALARQNAAENITEVITLAIMDALRRGSKPRAALVRDVGRKARITPAVKRAADTGAGNPVEIVLESMAKRGVIEKTGRSAYQIKHR